MQGFIDRRIPLFLRRLVTMMPAIVVLAIGVDATDSSSLAGGAVVRHPVRARADDRAHPPGRHPGRAVDRRATTVVASIVAALIIGLNGFLLEQTFFG